MNENSQPNKSSISKIFVGGLSWETNAEKLSDYFEEFGEVVDVVVMSNAETGRSRGFGFVEFKDPASVRNVLSKSQHQLDGRNIDPKECNLKNGVRLKRDSNQSKIFVGGLPHDIKEDVLKEFFSEHGKVTEVVIMYDQEKRKTRGFGFVSFESEETVNRLVEDRFLTINGKKIEIKRAEPQRPMLKSNSSSMSNISMQSSHNNGYLSGLSTYMPLATPHHQLHAAHHHSIMPPPAQNALDSSAAAFQFAAAAAAAASYHHPNSYSTAIPIHPHHSTHHSRTENTTPLIAGYAPTPLSNQPPSHHQLVSHQPWPLPSYPLGHLHSMQPSAAQHHHQQPHHSMQSPTASNIVAHQQAVSIIQNNSAGNLIQQQQQQQNANLSRPGSPIGSLSTSNNNSTASNNPTAGGTPNSQSTNNANLAQLNSSNPIHTPQSVTPTAMHQQNWYPNTHYSSSTPTPVPHPSLGGQPPGLIANPPGPLHGQANPAFSQAITFGYPPAAYVPAGLMSAAHWQQNPYVYGAYPLPYQTQALTTSSPPAIVPSQSITPQQGTSYK